MLSVGSLRGISIRLLPREYRVPRGQDKERIGVSDIVRRLPADGEVRDRQQRFLAVSGELERQVWDLLLGPMTGRLHILQLGAVVEIMPGVYVQALRLDRAEAPDRYIRLWYAVPTPDGGTEERTLLCFYTPGFPDPQYAQLRPGMDLNSAWWEAVRERLATLAAEQPEPWQLNEPGAEPWELPPAPRWQSAGQHGERPPATGAPAHIPPTSPPFEPDTATSSHQARVHLTLLQQNQFLFEEYKRLREEAYRERDTLERQLREAYFALYPFMRQAVQHATEIDVGRTVARWAEQGCPPPAEAPMERPASGGQQTPHAQAAPTDEPRPWELALQLARAEARVRERRDTLEQLCELAGGHQPLPKRDPETGKLRTVCERCDAQLYNRAPDIGEGWVR